MLYRMVTTTRRQAPAMSTLPVADAADELCDGRATWYRDWVTRRDLSDPFWTRMQLNGALDRVRIPVLLQTGWQDLFLPQTLAQYGHLNRAGVEVQLTVGPWTHIGMAMAAPTIIPEALDWLAVHLADDTERSRIRTKPVRIFVRGAKQWRDLPDWPPPTRNLEFCLQPGGGLDSEPAPEGAVTTFTYDPTNPTPTVGGRVLSPRLGGYRGDASLSQRSDVLTFETLPLDRPLEVIGTPTIELVHTSDSPTADLFVRVSQADSRGRSRNVTDGFRRLDPSSSSGTIAIELDATAHTFPAGSRVRLLIAGGSFPRWERNLGTADDPATSTTTRPSHRTITLAGSRLRLPVTGDLPVTTTV
jgi:putative CocE/NonD family hydrolase